MCDSHELLDKQVCLQHEIGQHSPPERDRHRVAANPRHAAERVAAEPMKKIIDDFSNEARVLLVLDVQQMME